MSGWTDMFGAPPRALTDEELLRAVQPIPLRPLDIAPEAPASLGKANPLGQGPASTATTYSSDNYGAPLSIPFDQLMAPLSLPPLRPLNYADAPANPANDAGLNPADDWQKRGRDTAAMALSALYPQNPPIPVAAIQGSNVGTATAPIQAPGAQQNWANPTGGKIRGCDPLGCGNFQASRTGPAGPYPHAGADYSSQPGQDVHAAVDGTVTRLGYPYGNSNYYRYVEVTSPNGEVVKHFYVSPSVSAGAKVNAGDVIGTAQSFQPRYPGITDHVHIEIRKNNQLVNPEPLIPK